MNSLANLTPHTIALTESYGTPDDECDEHRECRDCPRDGRRCLWMDNLRADAEADAQSEWEARRDR